MLPSRTRLTKGGLRCWRPPGPTPQSQKPPWPRPFRSAPPRPPIAPAPFPEAQLVPPPWDVAPPFQPCPTPPPFWPRPLRPLTIPPLSSSVRMGGPGLHPAFPPQYVGALEDMLQALKTQAR